MQQAKVTIAKMRTQQTTDNSNRFASKKAEKMLVDLEENIRKVEIKQKELKTLLMTAYNAIAKIVMRFNLDSPNISQIDKVIANSEDANSSKDPTPAGSMSMFIKEYNDNSYPSEDEILDIVGSVEISINDYMLKFAKSHGNMWNPGMPSQKITQYTVGFPDENFADYTSMYESIIKNNTQAPLKNDEPLSGDYSDSFRGDEDNAETFGFKALGRIREHLRHKAKTISELEAGMAIKKDDIEQYRSEMMKELENAVLNDNATLKSLFAK